MTLLTDSDANVRAGAIMAIETFPLGFDGQVLLRILDEQPNLFKGVPAAVPGYSDIYWELLRAIAGTSSKSPDVRERLRSSVADPTNGQWLIAGLTRSDPDWVLGHAREIIIGQPMRVTTVLANLDDQQKRARFVEALREENESFRKAAAASLDEVISDPRQRERLAHLLVR